MIWTTAKLTEVKSFQTAIPARAGTLGATGLGRSSDRRAVRVATGRRSYTGLRVRPDRRSARPELVGLLDQPQVGERLRIPDAVDPLEPVVQELEEGLVVLGHRLDEDVVAAR